MLRPQLAAVAPALLAALFAASAPSAARAGQVYVANLQPLNDSGVSGTARLTLNDDGTLTVDVNATNLEAGQVHPQHIHGFLNGQDSVTPPRSSGGDAASENGTLISVAEGAPFYGPILLPLEPTPSGATVNFSATFDDAQARQLSATAAEMLPGLATEISGLSDLTPLDLREIVLHGMTVDGQYVATLPVASGTITAEQSTAIPLPPAAWAALTTVAGFGGLSLLRRRLACRA